MFPFIRAEVAVSESAAVVVTVGGETGTVVVNERMSPVARRVVEESIKTLK